MLDCPRCGAQTNKLIIPEHGKLGCKDCSVAKPRPYNVNLGQTFVKDHMTRLTTGKAWEIEQRVVSPDDGKTIINRKTGRETQY